MQQYQFFLTSMLGIKIFSCVLFGKGGGECVGGSVRDGLNFV